MVYGALVVSDASEGSLKVLAGTWSRDGETGFLALPVGGHDTVHVRPQLVQDMGARRYRYGCVYPVEAAIKLGLGEKRVLVHRSCCGYDWVSTREEFMESRLRGACVSFHTPNHDLHMDQLFAPEKLVAKAEAAWLVVEGILGETEGRTVEGS